MTHVTRTGDDGLPDQLTGSTRDTVEQLIAAADGALYSAKRNGRNRVESAPQLALHG